MNNNLLFKYKIKIIVGKREIVLLLLFVAILSKIIEFSLLPNNFFVDSIQILNLAQNKWYGLGDSYLFTSNIYRLFIILGINTRIKWSILLGIIGNAIIIPYIKRQRETFTLTETALIILVVFFMNVYVFNISKDFLQFIIFFLAFKITESNAKKKYKVLGIALLFTVESLMFRKYYILLVLLVLFYWILKRTFKIDYKYSTIIFVLLIPISQFILPSAFYELAYSRDLYGFKEANSIIINYFNLNNTTMTFYLNSFLNIVRCLFPIELLIKGVYYFPFVIFQFIFSLSIINYAKQNGKHRFEIKLSVVLAFIVVSSFFEPDFGSLIRHEITLFPFIIFFVIKNNYIKEKIFILKKGYRNENRNCCIKL